MPLGDIGGGVVEAGVERASREIAEKTLFEKNKKNKKGVDNNTKPC